MSIPSALALNTSPEAVVTPIAPAAPLVDTILIASPAVPVTLPVVPIVTAPLPEFNTLMPSVPETSPVAVIQRAPVPVESVCCTSMPCSVVAVRTLPAVTVIAPPEEAARMPSPPGSGPWQHSG